MATRAQKAKVGLFVISCGLLIAAGILLISGYKHEERVPYYIEFDESVLGLSAGGLVEYWGVPVGTINDIYVTDKGKAHVDILITKGKVTLREGVSAQLAIYSFATGTFCVSLRGGHPDDPVLAPGSEIRAEPSVVANFTSRGVEILEDLEKIVEAFQKGMVGMEEGDFKELVEDAHTLLARADEFLGSVNETLQDVKEDAERGLAKVEDISEDVRQFVGNMNDTILTVKERIEPLDLAQTQENLDEALAGISDLVERLQETAVTVEKASRTALHEADNVEYNLRETLRTLNESLETVRELAAYLKQDPSAVVRGKGKPAGGK